MKMLGKIFLGFAGTVLVAVLGFTVLHALFGLRVELWGATKPHFYFYKPEAHFAAIEKSRAGQKTTPAPVQDPVAPAPPSVPPHPEPAPSANLPSTPDH